MDGRVCKRMTVHAMGVDEFDNIVYAHNYNETECTGEEGKCGCIHAEIALLKKMPHPHTIFTSHSPCLECAKALVDAGVKQVSYMVSYRLTDGIQYLLTHHVVVVDLRTATAEYVPCEPVNMVTVKGKFKI